MISSELDADPDRPEDGSRCQVHGNTVLTEGKYAKKGTNATIPQHYETDKPYIQWVRTHMQKLRVYIFQRDAMKMERIHRDRFLQGQEPPNSSMAWMEETWQEGT